MTRSVMKSISGSILSIALCLFSATAHSMDSQGSPNEHCLERMKVGKFKDQCLDTSSKRALKVITWENDQTLSIQNFRKNGEFYQARIPLNHIEKVSYLVVDLDAKPLNKWGLINVSHTQLRLQLAPGAYIELTSSNRNNLEVLYENDFIISVNYMAPKDVPYDPVKGFDETLYGSVMQMYATSEEAKVRFLEDQVNVYEIPLRMTKEQAGSLTLQAILTSSTAQYTTPYDSWSSNCTTAVFDLIDQALELKNQKPYRFKAWIFRDTGMIPAFKALGKRGLIDPQAKLTSMNREFGYPQFPSDSNRYFKRYLGKRLQDL